MSLTHYPISLDCYGKNPYGDNLFRIVFADSRRSVIFGEWPDGSTGASEEPRYPAHKGFWVLERWLSAQEYAGCTRDTWNWKYSILGPYPDRGEYELCHVFDAVSPVDSNLGKLISWIEEGRKRSYQEIKDACQKSLSDEKRSNNSTADAMIRDRMSAHLDFPMSGRYASRNTKTADFRLTAEQLSMPTGHNKFVTSRISL